MVWKEEEGGGFLGGKRGRGEKKSHCIKRAEERWKLETETCEVNEMAKKGIKY